MHFSLLCVHQQGQSHWAQRQIWLWSIAGWGGVAWEERQGPRPRIRHAPMGGGETQWPLWRRPSGEQRQPWGVCACMGNQGQWHYLAREHNNLLMVVYLKFAHTPLLMHWRINPAEREEATEQWQIWRWLSLWWRLPRAGLQGWARGGEGEQDYHAPRPVSSPNRGRCK